ncbi:MAG: ATP-binding protein [Ilumatobacteraceae bacterium]
MRCADGIELTREDAAAVYFVCLEALQNVAKHGGPAVTASISVDRRADDLVVEVTDDGPGFDPEAASHRRGLLNMADRAGALGGELAVESVPGRGTRVTMRLPLGDRRGAHA